jgi:hypothetical protein
MSVSDFRAREVVWRCAFGDAQVVWMALAGQKIGEWTDGCLTRERWARVPVAITGAR